MNILSLSLSSIYDSVPPNCQINFCGKELFKGSIKGDLDLQFDIGTVGLFDLKIIKTGKTMVLVKNKEEQVLTIKNVNLNGIDLKTKEFGQFNIRNNPFVKDKTIQTDQLHLDGIWTLNLPERTIHGDILYKLDKVELRDTLQDCDIACFGCSQTWGSLLSSNETWPARLHEITGGSVMNYGIYGSNINEIISFVDHYIANHKSDTILMYLPHSYRRLIKVNGEWKRITIQDAETRDLILHGEEHSIASLSGQIYNWLENISSKTRVYFGTYHRSEYELFKQTPLKKYMVPFLDSGPYPKASDDLHNGTEFNQDLAKTFAEFLKLG